MRKLFAALVAATLSLISGLAAFADGEYIFSDLTEPVPVPAELPVPQSFTILVSLIGAGALLLIVAAVTLIVIVKKKKKASRAADETDFSIDAEADEETEGAKK